MGITIEKISDNEHFEYKGDVHVTGSIGRGATVVIKDGDLIVDGDVADGSDVSMTQEQSNAVVVAGGSIFMHGVSIGGVNAGKSLTVKGDVGNNVTFNSHNADFIVERSVGERCRFKTHNGDITTGNVGTSTSLKTHNGSISSGNVSANASLVTHNGSVRAGNMGESTTATSHNGDVDVKNAPKSATLETHNGNVYENGVKRKKDKAKHGGASIQIGNMYMSGVSGGRIIVNGKDITDIVNRESNQGSQQQEKPPVRYFK